MVPLFFRIACICVLPHQYFSNFMRTCSMVLTGILDDFHSFLQQQLITWHHLILTLCYSAVYTFLEVHLHKCTHIHMQSTCLAMAAASVSLSFQSFVHGHHEYYRSWMPVNGELLPVKREISNHHNPFAVMVWKDGVVGHAPMSLSKFTCCFLTIRW